MNVCARVALACALLLPATAAAQRAEWNAPQKPFQIAPNTWFVGTHGLSVILVTSPQGHVLIDGALPESAPLIEQSIRALGFRVEDVKVILNTHDHYDHAGGIAELQRASAAEVRVLAPSAPVLEQGRSGTNDPQYGVLSDFPKVANVHVIADGDTVRVGPLALVAHATPGHTPGGTSWSWRACESSRCVDVVYADSQTPVSADGFLYTANTTYPTALADFARGLATIEALPCDILLTPHPDASGMWERVAKRDAGDVHALADPSACRRFVVNARKRIAKRVADEKKSAPPALAPAGVTSPRGDDGGLRMQEQRGNGLTMPKLTTAQKVGAVIGGAVGIFATYDYARHRGVNAASPLLIVAGGVAGAVGGVVIAGMLGGP